MTTPSSQATSPSPPTYFLSTPAPPLLPMAALPADTLEREERQRAIKKFLARAEISLLTRTLRTRLSYASYKATHNIHHVSIRDLEAQSQSQAASFSRTIAAKRRATGSHHHTRQGSSASVPGAPSHRRGGSSAMPPPASTSSPRAYYSAVNGNVYPPATNSDVGPSTRPTTSLYTSILAPPPTHHARTIHNAGDPPVPAPARPVPSPRVTASKTTSRSPRSVSRSHPRNRKPDSASSVASPRRKAKRSSAAKSKSHSKDMDMDVDEDGDVDMKAAATLTSLLLHHRPSITGSASSPRSSIDGSESGSAYSHFQQSSARTTNPNPSDPAPAVVSVPIATESSVRAQTPPSLPAPPAGGATPGPAPTDNEAASLMLFLATSPSPARPANKDARDAEAFRTLGGGPAVLRDKGRVLFASGCPEPRTASESGNVAPLVRSGDNSFTSSISSIGADMGNEKASDSISRQPSSQLLPPPTFPPRMSVSRSPPGPGTVQGSPRPPSNTSTVEFNFNDFIHGSPSPLRATPAAVVPKANLGLRADVGRKLFEEEQMRQALSLAQSPGKRQDPPLRAGIDLVKT